MAVAFTKMHGLGNDFVVFDATHMPIDLNAEQIRWIARRRFGVGCDQVLVLEPGRATGVDFRFRIFNADGSEVGQCGNGVRCLARFVRDQGLTDKTELRLQSLDSLMTLTLQDNGAVTADMGVPEFEPAHIPFAAPAREVVYDLDIGEKHVQISVLALGNPHAVQIVDKLDDAIVATEGPLVENHPRFPNRVNAGFMQVLNRQHVCLRVHERGVGETLACGSGACAAVVAGRQRGLLADTVEVTLPGGKLQVSWPGEGQPVLMTGPTATTYHGTIELEGI
jgi:diaminopimelate epimerase